MEKQRFYVVQHKLQLIDAWYDVQKCGNKEHALERFNQLSNDFPNRRYRVIEREIVEIEVYTNEEQPESDI